MRGSPLTISTMRDIKFRVIVISGDKFCFGNLTQKQTGNCHIGFHGTLTDTYCHQLVRHTSVGQFTGLTDINQIEIYEGDIVKCVGNEEHNVMTGIFPIEFHGGMFTLSYQTVRLGYFLEYYEIEVIGNIHQNPELLK